MAGDVRETTDELFSQAGADDPRPERTGYPFPPEQLAVIALTLTGPDRVRAIIGRLFEACGDDPRHLRYALGYLQWTMADAPAEQLGRALLPVVIADFEELLSALLRLWLTLYPRALGIDSRSVLVEEVTIMRSIEDFTRLQVDERVRLLVNGGPEEWDRVSTKSLHIPLSSLTDAWPVLVEALARRNAVIHSGGRVDRRYLNQAPVCDPQPVLGSILDCGADYVASVIDATERIGQVLAVELLCRLNPKSAVAVEAAAEQVFQALLAERWADALRMAETALGCSPAERDGARRALPGRLRCPQSQRVGRQPSVQVSGGNDATSAPLPTRPSSATIGQLASCARTFGTESSRSAAHRMTTENHSCLAAKYRP